MISNDWLFGKMRQLIKLSNITETQIQEIWIKGEEEYLTDFSSLEYNHNAPFVPLQKMIFTYRNEGNSATGLWNCCNHSNKKLLLFYFDLVDESDQQLMEFFSWIATKFFHYQSHELESPNMHLWKQNNIEFYFSLSMHDQNTLIEKYNRDCVTQYNKLLENYH
jgi:hypothetical protein